MNLVGIDGVAIQVFDYLNREDLALDLNLIGLHGLLDPLANLAQPGIDTGLPNTSIGGVFDRFQQAVVGGVEGYSKGGVDHISFDVGAEVDLHDIVVVQNCVISKVGGVVGCAVVDGASCGEGDT